MTYVSAVLRIQAGGVEPFRYRKVLYAAMPALRPLSSTSASSPARIPRKSRFRHRIDRDRHPAYDLHAFAKQTTNPRATIPHSCVMCPLP